MTFIAKNKPQRLNLSGFCCKLSDGFEAPGDQTSEIVEFEKRGDYGRRTKGKTRR